MLDNIIYIYIIVYDRKSRENIVMSTKENNKVVLGYRNKKYQRSIIETGIIIVAVLFMFLSLMIFTGGKTDDIIVGVVMLLMMGIPLVITLLIGRSKKNKLKNSSTLLLNSLLLIVFSELVNCFNNSNCSRNTRSTMHRFWIS